MKNKEEILADVQGIDYNITHNVDYLLYKSHALKAMEEYASEYKAAYDKILEEKATDVSFHYADLEDETTEKLKDKISEMIYNAIPTGEVDAFTLIKVLKKLKSDVEAI